MMFLDLYKCLLVNTKNSGLFCLKPLYLRFTCDVLGPVQMFTSEHKRNLVLSCLKHPYLRFTCVGDGPGPVKMFTCEQKESFMVP